jgi:hypothetical protein
LGEFGIPASAHDRRVSQMVDGNGVLGTGARMTGEV